MVTFGIASPGLAEVDYLAFLMDGPPGDCEIWKVFDVAECVDQIRERKVPKDQELWKRNGPDYCREYGKKLEHKLAVCDHQRTTGDSWGDAERAIVQQEMVAYVQDAPYVLFEDSRLVCQQESQFRETMNAISVSNEPRPRFYRSGHCKILEREVLVYLDGVSEDGRVAEIRYSIRTGGPLRTAYTERGWIVSRKRYEEILKERKAGAY